MLKGGKCASRCNNDTPHKRCIGQWPKPHQAQGEKTTPPDPDPFTVCPFRLNRVTESRIRGELGRRDPSGSGVISENSLRKVLEAFGVDLAGADLGRLMHRFDAHEVKIITLVCSAAGQE